MNLKSSKTISTGILSAVLSSLCCIAPGLAFISGAAPALSWIAPIKPYLTALSITMLSISWYQKLKPRRTEQAHCDHHQSFWQSKLFLGIVTVFVLVTLALPYFSTKCHPIKCHK